MRQGAVLGLQGCCCLECFEIAVLDGNADFWGRQDDFEHRGTTEPSVMAMAAPRWVVGVDQANGVDFLLRNAGFNDLGADIPVERLLQAAMGAKSPHKPLGEKASESR